MEELKPCPFCGDRPEMFCADIMPRKDTEIIANWTVRCNRCGIEKKATSFYRITFDEALDICLDGRKNAIEAWNRRVSE